MQAYYPAPAKALVKHFHVNEDVPFGDLPEQFKQALYFGTNGTPIEMISTATPINREPAANRKRRNRFEGLVPQMQRFTSKSRANSHATGFAHSWTPETCKVCNGATAQAGNSCSYHKESTWTRTEHSSVHPTSDRSGRTVCFKPRTNCAPAKHRDDVVREIQSRLQFLVEVGSITHAGSTERYALRRRGSANSTGHTNRLRSCGVLYIFG